MSFVGLEQGMKNCFNNSPLGCLINAPKRAEEMFSAIKEGDFDKVLDLGVQNLKNSCFLYSGSIFGLIDNFTD